MDLIAAFNHQAQACHSLGSRLYGELLEEAAADLAAGGVVADIVEGWTLDPVRHALALRFMAGVHRLVLEGSAADLERHFPTAGGEPSFPEVRQVFMETLREHPASMRAAVQRPVQTNEVGRSAALIGGLFRIAERSGGLPMRLREIGSSAGLNLLLDRYRYELGGLTLGPSSAPVVVSATWRGIHPTPRPIEVADRVGSDVAPIDVTTPSGALHLQSFVWADQVERMETMRGAIDLFREVGPTVMELPAAEFVESLGLAEGHVTVLMHSVMWQYAAKDQKDRVRSAMALLGLEATPERPLAWLSFEPRPQQFPITLRMWPDGSEEVLGTGHPHGRWVAWDVPERN